MECYCHLQLSRILILYTYTIISCVRTVTFYSDLILKNADINLTVVTDTEINICLHRALQDICLK